MALIETQPRRRNNLSKFILTIIILLVIGGIVMFCYKILKPSNIEPKQVTQSFTYSEFINKEDK